MEWTVIGIQPHNAPMGQVFPSATVRCERCDALKVIVKPIDGKGPRALRCPKCNDLDPMLLPAGWTANCGLPNKILIGHACELGHAPLKRGYQAQQIILWHHPDA
jgi:hypothetical protein